MSGLTVTALVCPDCGSQLAGLRYDRVFFCDSCRHGLAPDPEKQWVRYPLAVAKPESPPSARIIYLPFWQVNIEAFAQCVNKQQEVASRRLAELTSVWATGFIVNRGSYFGDLGLFYTEKAVAPAEAEALPYGAVIAGCARTPEDAQKYVRLYVTLILDKRADVTGMDLNIITYDARLWAIPFADYGDKIMDLITLHEFPAFSLDDLEGVRKLNTR
ncbi:MAG TPA: hypothetical protein VM658_12860 [bacterium]|nr:hypothetical protein [bacterium]